MILNKTHYLNQEGEKRLIFLGKKFLVSTSETKHLRYLRQINIYKKM